MRHLFIGWFLLLLMMSGCDKHETPQSVVARDYDAEANALFDQFFEEWLERSPLFKTSLGIKTDYDKWDNISELYTDGTMLLEREQLQRLLVIDIASLSPDVALSYRLMKDSLEQDIEHDRWRHHDYPVNQMFGWHTYVPSVLINMHTVSDISDAEAYLSRIEAVPTLFEQLIAGLELRAEKGIIAPKFVFPMVIDDSQNLLKGAPFDDGADSPLLANFKTKVEGLDIDDKQREELIARANTALLECLKPAYESLIVSLGVLQEKADDRAGVWKLPDGEAFYNAALAKTTTTNLSANEIHDLGLSEVERIHREMHSIMATVDFDGSLQEFFAFMRDDEQFYYPATDEGRAAYLAQTHVVLAEIEGRLDELFITKPQSALKIKRVEAFREKSAGKAFYQSPPPDGSRPGIYYANLYNMKEMPRYQLDALLYHEGLPGHHLQLSIATELKGIPRFRKHGSYTAYIEGWGLYSEFLPKEIGLYKDPYSDFGRLVMELWRACRLVTDTGLHAKQWTREQAINYLIENTPNPERDSRRAIERYIVMPSQATAYKIGMMKFIELREKSREILGDKFDVREYHELVLRLGAVPLNILEEQVDRWAQERLKP
ncbi:MAG: hypothetical protein ACI93R_001112 [Flavobacteriales bacterium]|jgi:uncharacterized protein (DUF885 family)